MTLISGLTAGVAFLPSAVLRLGPPLPSPRSSTLAWGSSVAARWGLEGVWRDQAPESATGGVAGCSRSRDLHASLGAIGPEQHEGGRRDACVSYVPDCCPRVCSEARDSDMVCDVSKGRNIRDTAVARDVGQQSLARLESGEIDGR